MAWLALGATGEAWSQTQRQAYAPRGEPMTFALAEGDGPLGARRWIAASGQIQRDTPKAFEAFKAAHPVEGLVMTLDSTGGSVGAGMVLGKMLRASGVQTMVARTLTVAGRQSLRSLDVSCASSCVLMLMGGVRRYVPEDARVDVHMFSVNLTADGEKVRPEVTMRDVEDAQRSMARHAVYVAEMGIGLRYLELMTEASFKGPIRRLTQAEIKDIRLADATDRQVPTEQASAWALTAPGSPPQMLRAMALLSNEKQTVDHELVLSCDGVAGFYTVLYRQVLTKVAQPAQPISLVMARLDTGGWDYVFRAPARPLATNKQGGDVWMRRSVPRKVLDDAVANRKLMVEVTGVGARPAPTDFYDPSLAAGLPELGRRCDSRPGRVSVGPHPRR